MAVKKKKAVRKTTKMATQATASDPLVDHAGDMREALSMFQEVVQRFETAAAAVDGGQAMPQELIVAASYLPGFQTALEEAEKAAKLAAKRARMKGGFTKEQLPGHQLGVVTFKVTKGQVRPKWQERAVQEARKCASLLQDPFDEEVYVEGVRAETDPGKDWEKVIFGFVE